MDQVGIGVQQRAVPAERRAQIHIGEDLEPAFERRALFLAACRIGEGVENFIGADLDTSCLQLLASAEPVAGEVFLLKQGRDFIVTFATGQSRQCTGCCQQRGQDASCDRLGQGLWLR